MAVDMKLWTYFIKVSSYYAWSNEEYTTQDKKATSPLIFRYTPPSIPHDFALASKD